MNPFDLGKIQALCKTLNIPSLKFDERRFNRKEKEPVVVLEKIKIKNLKRIMLKNILVDFRLATGYRRYKTKNPTKNGKKTKTVRFHKVVVKIGGDIMNGDNIYRDSGDAYYSSQLYSNKGRTIYIAYNELEVMTLIAPICILILQKNIGRDEIQKLFSHAIIKILEIALGGTKMRKQKLDDVCGYEKEKKELLKIIKVRLKPELVLERKLGSRNPILVGQPGNGKSMILRALANYAEENGALVINFTGYMKLEVWLPIVSELTQSLNVPVVICIDEIDEIGVARDIERTRVYEFLRLIDGLCDLSNVTFIATTNRPHLIDVALLRPERFNPMYRIGLPDKKSRHELILRYCSKFNLNLTENEIENFIKKTEFWSCADIRGVIEDIVYLHDGNLDFTVVEIFDRINEVSEEKVKKNKAWDKTLEEWKTKQDIDINIM